MSRIGKQPIALPDGVELKRESDFVVVKGKQGELQTDISSDYDVKVEDGEIVIGRPNDSKKARAMHGLYRSLINNMITGVSEGYKETLELIGVGYRVEVNGNVMQFSLGYSHPVYFVLPPEVKAETEYKKGENPKLILSSIDKQLLGQMVAKVRAIRPPEPYKGKGVRIKGEYVRRKAGKAGKAA